MMPHSLNRFIQLFDMLCKEIGVDRGRTVFKRIISALGEGNRIRVPQVLHQAPLLSKYYWTNNPGQNTARFCNTRDLLLGSFGNTEGVRLFGRVVATLGPGDKVTVPMYKCERDICSREQCGVALCLWREQRNQLIRDEFTGDNHEELALKWKLDPRTIRRIVNE